MHSTNPKANTLRRNFFAAGAAVAAGSLLASKEAKAGNIDVANIRAWTPANGIWDGAFQSALLTGMPIYFPPGTYLFSAPLLVNSNRDLVMFGDGPDVSKLQFQNATDGIQFIGRHYRNSVDQLMVRNLGIIAGNGQCLNGIFGYWTWYESNAQAVTLPAAIIENVSVSQANETTRFITGICLFGADHSRIVNCHFTQFSFTTGLRDAYGVILDSSDSNACETQITGCQFVNHLIGIWLRGWVEGTKITNCSLVGSRRGIVADAPAVANGLGSVVVSECHFDTYDAGIHAKDVYNLQVNNNYFIAEHIPLATTTSYCVRLERSRDLFGNSEDSIISNNLFRRNDAGTRPIYGVYANGASTQYRVRNVLIDANRYCGHASALFTNIAYLGTNTSRIRFTDTNLADGWAHGAVINLGTDNVVT